MDYLVIEVMKPRAQLGIWREIDQGENYEHYLPSLSQNKTSQDVVNHDQDNCLSCLRRRCQDFLPSLGKLPTWLRCTAGRPSFQRQNEHGLIPLAHRHHWHFQTRLVTINKTWNTDKAVVHSCSSHSLWMFLPLHDHRVTKQKAVFHLYHPCSASISKFQL